MEDLYRNIELPLIYTLFHMEDEGIAVRREELTAYGGKLKKQIAVLEKEIWEMTGQEFNINSPKQLGEILFEKMQIKGGKKTKTGYSTAADVLEKLAPDYPVIQKILDYRQYTKLNSTYADGLGTYIKEDGRIHSRFNRRSRRRAVSPARSRTSRTFRSAWSLDGRSGRSLSRGMVSCSWMPTTPRSSCAFSPTCPAMSV